MLDLLWSYFPDLECLYGFLDQFRKCDPGNTRRNWQCGTDVHYIRSIPSCQALVPEKRETGPVCVPVSPDFLDRLGIFLFRCRNLFSLACTGEWFCH